MDDANVYMEGSSWGVTREKSMPKANFVSAILPQLMGLEEGTHPLKFSGQDLTIDVAGSEEPKKIETPRQSVDV